MVYCFYCSDHGFGHAARCVPIVAQLLRLTADSDERVYVVCGQRQRDFVMDNLRELLGGMSEVAGFPEVSGASGMSQALERVVYRAEHTDVGLVLKPGTLDVDVPALTAACESYLAALPERAEREAEWLRAHDVTAALCDMPLWSIRACELASVPLLYAGNFTWAELYREWLSESIWRAYADEYARIRHGMLYALHNQEMLELLANADLRETGVVARPFHSDVVERFRAGRRPIVFAAPGMSARFSEPVDVGDVNACFYTTRGVPMIGGNVTVISPDAVNAQDYVAAADYVITKAGWGTVCECLLASKPMALFARDNVLEDRTTIDKLTEQGLALKIAREDLTDMASLLNRLSRVTYPARNPYCDCAGTIARRMLQL